LSKVIFDPSTHSYSDENGDQYPSVTTVLADAGVVDFSVVKQEIRERAMRRGTSVHFACQLWDENALEYRKVPKALRGYLKAWKEWRRASGFVPLVIEQPFISPHGYAGTPDRFGRFPNGTTAVLDLKSGKGDVADWVRIQTAAYARWYQIGSTLPPRRIGIQLHADGTYRVREFEPRTLQYDFSIFFASLTEWKGRHADRSTGQGTGTTVGSTDAL
jgi:hypothetical protein